MSSAAHARTRMSVDEFLAWDPGGDGRWQLVDGEPVAMAPAALPHGAIQAELGRLIGNHLVQAGAPCRVVTAPGVIPNLRRSENFRIPGLGVTCSPPDAGEYEMSDPVLLIEVMSPSNWQQTRANVWSYATIPTVTEIVTVLSFRVAAEVLRRTPQGGWPGEPELLGPDDALVLDSIGLAVPLRAIYRATALA